VTPWIGRADQIAGRRRIDAGRLERAAEAR
jgi:hypothetical protein